MKDKFKAMVGLAIENGWYDSKRNDKIVAAEDVLTDSITGITTITIMIVTVYPYGEVESYYKYTVSGLLLNHKFMGALLGEDNISDDSTCVDMAYLHHMRKLIDFTTDEQRIDYVHGLIKGEIK